MSEAKDYLEKAGQKAKKTTPISQALKELDISVSNITKGIDRLHSRLVDVSIPVAASQPDPPVASQIVPGARSFVLKEVTQAVDRIKEQDARIESLLRNLQI